MSGPECLMISGLQSEQQRSHGDAWCSACLNRGGDRAGSRSNSVRIPTTQPNRRFKPWATPHSALPIVHSNGTMDWIWHSRPPRCSAKLKTLFWSTTRWWLPWWWLLLSLSMYNRSVWRILQSTDSGFVGCPAFRQLHSYLWQTYPDWSPASTQSPWSSKPAIHWIQSPPWQKNDPSSSYENAQ